MRRKLAAGNWKMNGLSASLTEIEALTRAHPSPGIDILICPPATLVTSAVVTAGDHCPPDGAFDPDRRRRVSRAAASISPR